MNNEDAITEEKPQSSSVTRWLVYAGLLLLVFALGFVPMWLQSRNTALQLKGTEKTLRQSEIRGLLTTSIVEAKSGEYEQARQAASSFFTNLHSEEGLDKDGFLTTQQRASIKPIFENRDAVITMLAQRDQASIERLTDIYNVYKQAFPQPQMPQTQMPQPQTAQTPLQTVSPNALPQQQ